MKNRKIMILVIVLVVAGIIALSQVIKNRGGKNIECNADYPVSEKIVGYRQDDDAWKDIKLGNSKYTMKSSGCVTTCIATAISETADAPNPGELVNILSDNNVFDDNGNMQWSKLSEISGFNAEVYDDLDVKHIDECLSMGRYPIVKVHRKSLFSYHHFVLIIGSSDGEYICMDSLKDSFTKLSDYSNRIYSIRCVWKEMD